MRLIDADAYKDYICRNCTDVGYNFYGAKDISKCPCRKVLDIEEQPTAYNINKVMTELRRNTAICKGMNDVYLDGLYEAFDCAIGIVRRGIVDD